MFGTTHHEDVEPPQDDAASAQHVVIFASESEPEAERAAGIIENFGPNGIEEHHENSDQKTAGAYLPGVAAMRTIYPPGTAPGSLQFRAPEDSQYFGTQNAESPPTGHTFQNRMGTTPWASPDEGASDAGTAHPGPDAGSSDDTAAYRYGEAMRASDPSPARSWEETESSLQSDWERKRRHTELPAWHKIKEAVRRGWDRVKH
jgi:hypothetical protein